MTYIISGVKKGEKLKSTRKVRPTQGRVKSALFNIIGDKIKNCRFLDLFAGTGAVGLEALSRGAGLVYFVDNDKECMEVIRENLKKCGWEEKAKLFHTDARHAISLLSRQNQKFEFIFLDPPYERTSLLSSTLQMLGKEELLEKEGVCIIQHLSNFSLPAEVGKLQKFRESKYGETMLTFYKVKEK